MDPSFRVDVTLATSENDTYEILKEAKEMFHHGDMERSGHHFIQVFRIIRGEYDQDCVRYTRGFFQCTVHEYSQLFAKKLQDTRKLEAQLLHDAAMAYFVDRRKRSKARDTPFHNPGKPIWKGPYADAELLRLSVKQQDVSLALPIIVQIYTHLAKSRVVGIHGKLVLVWRILSWLLMLLAGLSIRQRIQSI